MLRQAEQDDIDVLCMQEAADISTDDAALLKRHWIAYTHGSVAILVSTRTTQKIMDPNPKTIWKPTMGARVINAMSITLRTKQGNLTIAAAYLPPGIDTMSRNKRANHSSNHKWTLEEVEEMQR
mgnify:CR=1 FL=1